MSPAAPSEAGGEREMATGEVDSQTLDPSVCLGQRSYHMGSLGACRGGGNFDWSFSSNLSFCSPGKVEGEKEEILRPFSFPVLSVPHAIMPSP